MVDQLNSSLMFRCFSLVVTVILSACAPKVLDAELLGPPPELRPEGNTVMFAVATKNGDREIAEKWMALGTFTQTSYCGAIAYDCMREDWLNAGDLSTISSQILAQSDLSATVELKMNWSKLGMICQQFTLAKVDGEWKVERVDAPRTCGN